MGDDRSRVSRPGLVFATRRAPFPLDSGARIRGHRLLSGLSEAFDTTLVYFEHHPQSPDGHTDAAQLRRLFPGVEVVTAPGLGPAKRLDQAGSLLSARSWSWGRYRRAGFAAALADAVRRRGPGVVHFDDLGVAQLGPFAGMVNVYSSHNVEQRILQLEEQQGSAPRRLFNAVEARKVRGEEEHVWRRMDLSLAVSPLDAQAMRAGGARRVEPCPNGTDRVDALPMPALSDGDELRIAFVGSGAYAPYERGLAWFVSEVLPRVRTRTPVRFEVVGQRPARPVDAPDVSYVGRVPSVAPYYERAHVVVVPVFEGSGTRLKLLEAVGYGRPVVSTRLGAEGLPLAAGSHYLQADDADAFAEALVDLARYCRQPVDPRLMEMLASARGAIEPLLWPNIVSDLVDLYRAELDSVTGRRAS
jgi:glycosyltransferase involved in cell wall biosynthesis